jgi:hypothetical protein
MTKWVWLVFLAGYFAASAFAQTGLPTDWYLQDDALAIQLPAGTRFIFKNSHQDILILAHNRTAFFEDNCLVELPDVVGYNRTIRTDLPLSLKYLVSVQWNVQRSECDGRWYEGAEYTLTYPNGADVLMTCWTPSISHVYTCLDSSSSKRIPFYVSDLKAHFNLEAAAAQPYP